jgi:hypothetical protein
MVIQASRQALRRLAMDPKRGSYRHVVLFKFKPRASAATVEGIERAFGELAGKLPFVTGFEWGRDSSPERLNKGFTHCFIVSFSDSAGRDAYLPHPEHRAFCRDFLDPNLEDVCVLDFYPEG